MLQYNVRRHKSGMLIGKLISWQELSCFCKDDYKVVFILATYAFPEAYVK